MKGLIVAGGTSLLLMSGVAGAAVYDFETPGQYAATFGTLYSGLTVTQSDNGADNDYVTIARPLAVGGSTRSALVYDLTPEDGATTKTTFTLTPGGPGLTVSADVLFTANTASWGFYFINASNRQQAFMSLFNVNASGSDDNIRFTSPTAATYVSPISSSSTESGLALTGNSIASADFATNEMKTISSTYSINDAGQVVMSLTAGSRTLVSQPITTLAAFTEIEVGLRISPAGVDQDYIRFDNFTIVPEPASLGVLGLAGLLLGRRRLD